MTNAKRTAKSFSCPECGARPGRECIGSRIPSANSFGGGWGGPTTRRPHEARQARRREHAARKASAQAAREAADAECRAGIAADIADTAGWDMDHRMGRSQGADW